MKLFPRPSYVFEEGVYMYTYRYLENIRKDMGWNEKKYDKIASALKRTGVWNEGLLRIRKVEMKDAIRIMSEKKLKRLK